MNTKKTLILPWMPGSINDLVENSVAWDDYQRSAWIKHDIFSIYLRVGKTHIEEKIVKAIVIANITSSNPGSGKFADLINHLVETYLDYRICVENVLEERFQNHLQSLGFIRYGEHNPPCFTLKR